MGRLLAILLACISGLSLHSQASFEGLNYSVKPGVYAEDQLLVLGAGPGLTLKYRVAANPPGEYLAWSSPLGLSAIEGETREYRIQLQLQAVGKAPEFQEIRYVIDKTPPGRPEPDLVPGTWYQGLTVKLSLPNPLDEAEVQWTWVASDGQTQSSSGGRALELAGRSQSLVSYRVQAWAVDKVGHSSPVQGWTWTVDRRRERDLAEIPVFSPVEGRFQNRQYLWIDQGAFASLRYSLDGSDPRNGQPYQGGVLLDRSGAVLLRVWGKTLLGKELERSIRYSAGSERLEAIESGVLGQALTLQLTDEKYHYTAGERSPGLQDDTLQTALRISPQTGALRGVALRLLRERDRAEFRYYLVLDGRQPPAPEIWARSFHPLSQRLETLQSGQTIQDGLVVESRLPEGCQLWYTLNGAAPEQAAAQRAASDGRLSLSRKQLEAAANAKGEVQLVFQARQGDGQWGPSAALRLGCAALPPAPQVKLAAQKDGSLLILPEREGQGLAYTVQSDVHPKAFQGPFVLGDHNRIELPFGASAQFSYRFAALGAQGQVGPFGPAVEAKLVNLAPQTPSVRLNERNELELLGSGILKYRLLTETAGPQGLVVSASPEQQYQRPVVLKPTGSQNAGLSLEAWAEDGQGRQSARVRSETSYFHNQAPGAPAIQNEGAELWRNQAEFRLALARTEPGMRYRYQWGPAGAVTDPGSASPWVTAEIPFSGLQHGQQIELRVQAFSPVKAELVSPVSRFLVNVALLQPPAPEISGVQDGLVTNRPLEIRLLSGQGRIFYRLEAADALGAPSWQEYRQAITVPAPADSDTSWQLQAYVLDRAGNQSPPGPVIRFRVLTRVPGLAKLKASDEQGQALEFGKGNALLARSAIKLERLVPADQQVRYLLTTDPGQIRLPDAQSALWELPLSLTTEDDSETTWYLQFQTVDKAGNASPASPVYSLTIDRRAPPLANPPQLIRKGNGGNLIWAVPEGFTLDYLLSGQASVRSSQPFSEAGKNPVAWSLAEGQDKLYVFYRLRDRAGNVSDVQTYVVERSLQTNAPRISGVEDGGVYREPVRIELLNPPVEAAVRYELTVGDQGKVEATPLSPVLERQLEVGPLPGETVRYHLSVRQYMAGLDPSDELALDFTIDRSPPAPPTISELPALSFHAADLRLRLEAEPGSQVFYAVDAHEQGPNEDQAALAGAELQALVDALQNRAREGDTVNLAGRKSAVMRYVLLAWTVDPAGNRSRSNGLWQIYIDGDAVYVVDPLGSPGGGMPQAENGTRQAPFTDLARAVQYARQNQRSSLRLASGRYALKAGIDLTGPLWLIGGHDPADWAGGRSGSSIIYPAAGFSGDSLFTVRDSLKAERLYLVDSGQKLQSLIRSERGSLELASCSLAITQSLRAIAQEGGTSTLRASTVACSDPLRATLVEVRNGTLSINDSLVESTELPAVLLKNQAKAEYELLSAIDSRVSIKESEFRPRRGLATTAIRVRGGSLELAGRVVWNGAGSQSATAFDIGTQATLTLRDCVLKADPNAGNAVLLRLSQARASLSGVTMNLAGGAGIYGCLADDANLDISDSVFEAGAARDFMTLVATRSSVLGFKGNRVNGSATGDFRVASLAGGESRWEANTVRISGAGGTGTASGLFFLNQGGEHTFTGNTLIGDAQRTLFYLASTEGKLTVRSNIIENWRYILQEADAAPLRQSEQDRGIESLQTLQESKRQGSLFEGNKVRQGL